MTSARARSTFVARTNVKPLLALVVLLAAAGVMVVGALSGGARSDRSVGLIAMTTPIAGTYSPDSGPVHCGVVRQNGTTPCKHNSTRGPGTVHCGVVRQNGTSPCRNNGWRWRPGHVGYRR